MSTQFEQDLNGPRLSRTSYNALLSEGENFARDVIIETGRGLREQQGKKQEHKQKQQQKTTTTKLNNYNNKKHVQPVSVARTNEPKADNFLF